MGKHKNGNIFLYERGKRRISPLFLPIRLLLLVWMKKEKFYGLETDGCGLLKYNYEEQVFEKVVLPENIRVVHKIIAANNELWLTTSNGMYCYQPENGSIKIYNKLDGLQENQFCPIREYSWRTVLFCRRY